jgi:hypothetical protein
MARFFNVLNMDIANVVELQHYMELEDMVPMVRKVERQIKIRGSVRPQISLASSSSVWTPNPKRKEDAQPKCFMHVEANHPRPRRRRLLIGKVKLIYNLYVIVI